MELARFECFYSMISRRGSNKQYNVIKKPAMKNFLIIF